MPLFLEIQYLKYKERPKKGEKKKEGPHMGKSWQKNWLVLLKGLAFLRFFTPHPHAASLSSLHHTQSAETPPTRIPRNLLQ